MGVTLVVSAKQTTVLGSMIKYFSITFRAHQASEVG